MRRKFALQYGLSCRDQGEREPPGPGESYHVKVHGTVIAAQDMRIGELLVVVGEGSKPTSPARKCASQPSA